MKKIMLLCLIFISTKTFSQDLDFLKRFEFGFKAGINYSNFTDFNYSTDPLIGYHAGGTIAFMISKNFMIQEDFLFSTAGAKNKSEGFDKNDIKLYYMSVPLLLKYRTHFGFYIEAGIQPGFKMQEEVSGLNGHNFAKKVDFAGVAGIGYQAKSGLGLGARYVYGIYKIGDLVTSTADNKNLKNAMTQVSLSYTFHW